MAEHKPEILWSPEALEDIDRPWDYYIHAAGRMAADKILRDQFLHPCAAARVGKAGGKGSASACFWDY